MTQFKTNIVLLSSNTVKGYQQITNHVYSNQHTFTLCLTVL